MALDAGGIASIVLASVIFLFIVLGILVKTSVLDVPALLEATSKLVMYSPYSLLVFGWIFDLATGNYIYTSSGVTAVIAMLINAGVSSVTTAILNRRNQTIPQSGGAWWKWIGDVSSVGADTSKCSLPAWPSFLDSKIAPQATILSMTILFYILIGQWNSGFFMESIGLSVITFLLFITQWVTMYYNGCLEDSFLKWGAPLFGLVLGAGFAAASLYIQQAINPQNPLNGGLAIYQNKGYEGVNNPGLDKDGEEIINVGGKSKIVSTPNDQDQFVCEAYKDGELVTSTIAG